MEQQTFQIFYNQELHPELLRLERVRKRLLVLFVVSVMLLIVVLYLLLQARIPSLSLFAAIPLGIYGSFIAYRIKRFKAVFKPAIVARIIDFMGLAVNYRFTQSIPKDTFLHSKLFETKAPYYTGEDYFEGKIAGIPFQICELSVRDQSPVLSRMDTVFRGIFFTAQLPESVAGRVLIFPHKDRQQFTRSIKAITREGGKEITVGFGEFEAQFLIYAKGKKIEIPRSFLEAVFRYQQAIQKTLLVSLVGKMAYVAIREPKDLLEPSILQSNVSFKMAQDFYEDLKGVTGFVQALGENNEA